MTATAIPLSQLLEVGRGRYQIRPDLTVLVELRQGANPTWAGFQPAGKNTADTLHLTQAELLDIASLCGQGAAGAYNTGPFSGLEGPVDFEPDERPCWYPVDATFKYYEAGDDMLRTKLWIYDNTRIILEQEPISGFSIKPRMELRIADLLAVIQLTGPVEPVNGHGLMDCPSCQGSCLQRGTDKDCTNCEGFGEVSVIPSNAHA